MLSDPYQGPVPAVPVLGVGRIRVSSEVLSEGAMASFQLSHLSLRHRGSPVSLPHNSSLICDCSIPPRSLLPEWGTSHSCIGWRTEKPTDTDVNIQMQIQKQTQAPAPVSQSPEGCVSGEQREGASRGRQR